jgi:tetratricopeptide (TPR) repeat protein
VALLLALGGWWVVSSQRKERAEAIDRLIKETQELISRDSAGSYRAAAEKAKEILKIDEGSLAGHAYLAYVDALRVAEHAEGDQVKAEALVQVDAARRIGPHSHLIAAEAWLRASGGDAAAAITDLKATLDDPARQTALLTGTLGSLLMRAGDLDGARDWLVRAQKTNTSDARLAQQLAEQYRRRGEGYEAQAESAYQVALRLQKDHVPSLLGRSLLLLDRGLYEQAAASVQKALAGGDVSSRQQALALAVRGSVLYAQGKAAEGAADEKKALELDPQSPDLPWLIGRRQLRDGETAAAVASIQRAVNGDGRRVAFYVDLTRALLGTEGGAQKAGELLQKATARVGDHPRIALLLGDAALAAGDADRARGQYERAIQLGKPFPDARVALARLLRDQKNVPQALAELDLAITEYGQGSPGGAAAAYVEMAETERSRGAKPEVLFPLYVKALEKDPARCEALWGAGKLGADAAGLVDEAARPRLERYNRSPAGSHVAAARSRAPDAGRRGRQAESSRRGCGQRRLAACRLALPDLPLQVLHVAALQHLRAGGLGSAVGDHHRDHGVHPLHRHGGGGAARAGGPELPARVAAADPLVVAAGQDQPVGHHRPLLVVGGHLELEGRPLVAERERHLGRLHAEARDAPHRRGGAGAERADGAGDGGGAGPHRGHHHLVVLAGHRGDGGVG